MALPTISIVTPSFNQAPYLEETILSVLGQEYPGLEYFIMDGGSADGSAEIIRKYEARLAGWTSGKDGGQADAIRTGFARATGEVLAYINSDDAYLPGALAAAGEIFAREPELDLLYGDLLFVDAAGKPLVVDVLPAYSWEDLKRVCVIPQPAAFWRRAAYERAGGIDASFRFAMDYDLFLRMAAGGRVMHVPRLMAKFRYHPAAKTSRAREDWAREDRLLRARTLGREEWNAADRLRLTALAARQTACIAARALKGERFPAWVPARVGRLARRRLGG